MIIEMLKIFAKVSSLENIGDKMKPVETWFSVLILELEEKVDAKSI